MPVSLVCTMRSRPEKILALQFKYFGDAVLMTPALRAIRGHCPNGELHLLVPEEIAPLFQHLPWLDRVWPMPRRRGSASLGQTWPVVRALRRERFDRSVDFASNDRGAILSFLIGARRRLGWAQRGGFFGRRFCYHQRVVRENKLEHESSRMMHLLSAWDIAPGSLEPEIHTDPALAAAAQKFLPERKIICHLASSQPKKEWPLCLTARVSWSSKGSRSSWSSKAGWQSENSCSLDRNRLHTRQECPRPPGRGSSRSMLTTGGGSCRTVCARGDRLQSGDAKWGAPLVPLRVTLPAMSDNRDRPARSSAEERSG